MRVYLAVVVERWSWGVWIAAVFRGGCAIWGSSVGLLWGWCSGNPQIHSHLAVAVGRRPPQDDGYALASASSCARRPCISRDCTECGPACRRCRTIHRYLHEEQQGEPTQIPLSLIYKGAEILRAPGPQHARDDATVAPSILPHPSPCRLLPIQPPRMLCRNLPAERHQRFTVGLAQLRTIQLFDQIRPNRIGKRQRLIATEAVDFPVVA